MKILWISLRCYPAIGGSERHFFEFMRRLVKDGIRVVSICTDIQFTKTILTGEGARFKKKKEVIEGIEIRRYPARFFPGQKNIAFALSRIRNSFFQGIFGYPFIWAPEYLMYAYFSNEKFDLVIAGPHPYYSIIYPALSFAKRQKIPFIDYPLIHTGLPHSNVKENIHINAVGRYIMENSDYIIGNTYAEKKIIETIGINSDKFYIIGAGINPDEIKGGDGKRFRNKYGIKRDIVLQVSVQSRVKGTITLIKAGELLIKKGVPVNIILIGEVRNEVEKYYKDIPYNIKRYIKLMGSMPERDKKDVLAASDVYVMVSEVDSFGIAYLEAWMYKKPVIGAYAGGIPYVIDDGINGYLVPFGDYHMLAEYIEILLKNKSLAKKIGQNGYQKTLKNYTWDIQYKKFLNLIKNISNRGKQ